MTTADPSATYRRVCDQQLIRDGLRLILDLQEDVEVVGEAADGIETLQRTCELQPDVVLLDIQMPRLDGLEVTQRVMTGPAPDPRVLILTTFDLDEYRYRALRAGVSGFLLKDVSRGQLVHAVRVMARWRRAPRPGYHQAPHRGVRHQAP